MPKISEAHAAARRRQVLEGARRAFAKHGYEGATVARLEEEVGLSRGAIFNYFENKWELFFALAREDETRFVEIWLDEGFGPLLRHMAAENPDWLGVYLELGRKVRTDPALRERWRERNEEADERLRAHLLELQRRGEIRRDMDIDAIGEFLGLVVDGVVVRSAAGFPTNVDALLRLVTAAIAPQ